MSTYWFPFCKTCNTDDHRVTWWNHGEEQIAELNKIMPELGRFARALRDAPSLSIVLHLSGPEWTNGLLDFAAVHGDHELAAKNEYGQLDTQCRDYWTCNGGHRHNCELTLNHEGDCGPRKRA